MDYFNQLRSLIWPSLWPLLAVILSLAWISVCLALNQYRQARRILRRHARRLKSLRYLGYLEESTLPPLTLLLPLHREKRQAVEILRRCMQMEYPRVDYVVIHNAADQDTFEALRENFGLKPVPRFPVAELSSRLIRGVYQSEDVPNLWVIDKEPGTLPDALNAGLNFCQTPLVAVLSPDFVPEKNALLQISRPFLENAQTWAVTGRIRPQGSGPNQPSLSPSRWARLYLLLHQRRELIQALLEDAANRFNWLRPELSLFRRASLVEAGGFPNSSVMFMVDTAIRLRRLARLQHESMRLSFVPDTLGWLPPPEKRKDLRQLLFREQQIRKYLFQHEISGKQRLSLLWQGLGAPLLKLLTLLLCLPLLLQPLWLIVWLATLLSPVAIWQRVLLLGELTSYRHNEKELQQLQGLAWALALLWMPQLALWYLQGWLKPAEKPLSTIPEDKRVSPLKQTARLGFED